MNRGGDVRADTMYSGIAYTERGLLVTHTGNHRMHVWDTKGDNRWALATRDSLCWPHGVAACGETLAIADSGKSRVVLWDLA